MTERQKQQDAPSRFWDERYSAYHTVYGEEPNAFFREQLSKLAPGRLLLPAEGEGRNAIYAAKSDWEVEAFDYSATARTKALARAADNQVTIHYTTQDINTLILPHEAFDAIALIYVHLETEARRRFHGQVIRALRHGGQLIFEAFSRDQIKNLSGGPKDESLLYDIKDLKNDFGDLIFSVLRCEKVRLNEGPFHQGMADVIRISAVKP